MVTALLTVIYIAYIGLGLPHSLFGAVWPAIQNELNLSISSANYITVIISGCTVISAMVGARLTNKFGTSRVVTVSMVMAAFALLGFSFSGNLISMCIFAVPLGLSAGATDAALNNYIALNYSARHMNFLHCFYGVGVMTSPYIMSLMLDTKTWQYGYRIIFYLQSLIAVIMILSLPLWKKVKGRENEISDGEAGKDISYISMAKIPLVKLDWIMCISINAIEGVGGIWASSYLVYACGFTDADAAGAVTLFYIGIALGRFLSGLISSKVSGWNTIKLSIGIMAAGIIMMIIPSGITIVTGLFLTGLGNGPVYPTIMHLTPRHFEARYSGSIIGSQMATAYFGIMAAPPLFGVIANKISALLFPYYTGLWLLIFAIVFITFIKKKSQI